MTVEDDKFKIKNNMFSFQSVQLARTIILLKYDLKKLK